MRFRAFVLHPTWCRASPSPVEGEGKIGFPDGHYLGPIRLSWRKQSLFFSIIKKIYNFSPFPPILVYIGLPEGVKHKRKPPLPLRKVSLEERSFSSAALPPDCGMRIEKKDRKIRNPQFEITEPMLFPRNGLLSRPEPCFSQKKK